MSLLAQTVRMAILAVTVFLTVFLIVSLLRTFSFHSLPGQKHGFVKGPVVQLPGYTPAGQKPTLVMAMSNPCDGCAPMVPLYRELAALRPGLSVVGVMPDQQIRAARYFEEHAIKTDAVLSLSPEEMAHIGMKRTPALLLLDEHGLLEGVWIGNLPISLQNQVKVAVSKGCPACVSSNPL